MAPRVDVDSKRRVYDGYFQIDEAVLRYERLDGTMSRPLTRLCFERGDGAAVVLHDPDRRLAVLVRQFRYPAWENGPGWLTELVAGVVGEGVDPREVARAEALEEAGYAVDDLEEVGTFYLSPGGSSERIFLFYAAVTQDQRREAGGGLDHEGEDIEVVELPLSDVWRLLDEGGIVDAKTLVGLQWLRHRLFSAAARR